MSKAINWGGAQMTRRSAPSTGPRMPAVPIPRKIQALIKMREAKGGAGRVIQAGGGGCNMAGSQVVSTVRNLPKVYSPLYEFSNLMLPRDMKTMNAWCLTGESLILTGSFEWKPIKDLVAGERVFTHTGEIAPIKGVMCREVDEEIVEIFVKGSEESISITDNHELYVLRKGLNQCKANHKNICKFHQLHTCSKYRCEDKKFELTDIKAADLRVGDCLAYPINKDVVDNDFWTSAKARLLGLYAAEGTADKNLRQVGLTFNIKEKELVEETCDLMLSEFGRKGRTWDDPNYNITRAFTTNSSFKDFVLEHCGKGSHTKKFSKEVMFLDPNLQLQIIGGYIDGDGHQYKNGRVVIDTMSPDLARQIQWMCYRNEINAYINKYTRIANMTTGCLQRDTLFWRVEIPAKHSEKLSQASIKVRPYKIQTQRCDRFFCDGYLLTPITKIDRKHHKGKVYNIEVDHTDHSYVSSVGAVHNCRHFFATNPIVRNAITLHATYPISKFNITCEDPKVKEFFEDMFDRMGFRGVLMGMALEFWKLGETFPYLELDEENGVWDYAFLHNPDFIRVKTNALARYPAIYLVPDDSLRRLVQGRSSADAMMRQQLPAETAFHIMKGEDIPLPNFNISHLKMMNSEYDVRGTSIITSCYKDLMLYDKIREQQFAQADGMINPLTLVKLGDPSGTWRPNDEDIRAFQQIMEESQYDPDFKIVTHGAVDIQRIGYSGATLDVSQMWDAINKNIYTGLLAPEAILNGEGPNYCLNSVDTQVLTNQGYLSMDEMIDYDTQSNELHTNLAKKLKSDIKIACFNPETECIEYHSPIDMQVFNYDSDVDGEMVHFHTKKIDLMTTPNHKMWVDRRKTNQGWHNKWNFQRADEVNGRIRRFRSVAKWIGEEPPSTISVAGKIFDYKDYLQFVGLYATEGYAGIYENREYGEEGKKYTSYRVGIAQSEIRKNSTKVSESFIKVKEVMERLPFEIHPAFNKKGQTEFTIYNKDLTFYMAENFGQYSENKHLTPEIKNLPREYLKLLLDVMVLGDGHVSTSNQHSRRGKNNVKQYQFFSTSKQLANDVYEIVFKVGYAPIMRLEVRNEERDAKFANSHDIWWVEWSDSEIGNYPTLDTRSKLYPDGAITRVPYKGKVFCFTVPYNLFVVRRNGKQSIQGNSTASIGLEVLRTRYDRFREQLAQWVEKKVLEPICKLQDFYMTKGGVRKLIIPKVQWNRLNLRDMDSYTAAITGLLATPEAPGKVSDRVLFESLDLDYEEEKKRLRKEAIDRAAMAQELQALGKMSLEELQTLDPDKPIVDTHKGEAAPVSPEQMLGGPGAPPMGGLGGKPPKGLPGGGGMGKPPRAPVGEGGKPPAGGTPTAPTPGGAPTPIPGGPPPAAPKGPAPGA